MHCPGVTTSGGIGVGDGVSVIPKSPEQKSWPLFARKQFTIVSHDSDEHAMSVLLSKERIQSCSPLTATGPCPGNATGIAKEPGLKI